MPRGKKIDDEIKFKIRTDYVTKGMSLQSLAKEYGISVQTIKRWCAREGWTIERDKIYAESLDRIETKYGTDKEIFLEKVGLMELKMPDQAMELLMAIDILLKRNREFLEAEDSGVNTLEAETHMLGVEDMVDIMAIHKAIKDTYGLKFGEQLEDNTWKVEFVGMEG